MRAVEYYNNNQKFKGRKKGRIMIEYVVIRDLNDSEECAHELGLLLQSRKCMINLIPFNPFDGNSFKEPTEEAVDRMVNIVSSYGVITIKRKHHGRDIAGACGQLAKISKDIEDDVGGCETTLVNESTCGESPVQRGFPSLVLVAAAVTSYLALVLVHRSLRSS
jgi:hypothetical protein